MSNPLKGEAKVKLSDGRVLTLAFDFDALIAVEEASGMRLPAILEELGGEPSLKVQRALVYGALRRDHPEIDLQQAGKLFLTEGEALSKAIDDSLAGSLGPADEEAEEHDPSAGPPKRGAGTGASSSRRGAAAA